VHTSLCTTPKPVTKNNTKEDLSCLVVTWRQSSTQEQAGNKATGKYIYLQPCHECSLGAIQWSKHGRDPSSPSTTTGTRILLHALYNRKRLVAVSGHNVKLNAIRCTKRCLLINEPA
jgi:hypothetical protein